MGYAPWNTHHSEDIAWGDVAQVRGRIDSHGSSLLGNILQVEHDVEAISNTPRWRLYCQLIRVQLHRHIARSCTKFGAVHQQLVYKALGVLDCG